MEKVFIILVFAVLALNLHSNGQNTETVCLAGDCFNGVGKMVWADGSYYIGEWENGQPKGLGFFKTKNEWAWGQFNGKKLDGYGGLSILDAQQISIGQWVDGKREGAQYLFNSKKNEWKATYFKKDKYVVDVEDAGCVKGDCTNGYSEYQYKTGNRYFGDYSGGSRQGNGTLIMNDGTAYKGEFKEKYPYGTGIYLLNKFRLFKGKVENGYIKDGIMYFPPGEHDNVRYIEGQFYKETMYEGTIYFTDGSSYNGEVKDNVIPHGMGTMTYSNGTTMPAKWIDGEVEKTVVVPDK